MTIPFTSHFPFPGLIFRPSLFLQTLLCSWLSKASETFLVVAVVFPDPMD